jgi:hypothetical protein
MANAIGIHAGLGPAQIDAIHVAGCEPCLPVGIDGGVAVSKRRPVEAFSNEAIGRALAVQPLHQPFHFQGQIDDVHGLPGIMPSIREA